MSFPKLRQKHATFLRGAPPITTGDQFWKQKTFRERCYDWASGLNKTDVPCSTVPSVLLLFYIFKMSLYVALYYSFFLDKELSLWAEKNVKRGIIYTMLGDAVGLNSTCGPLGFRSGLKPFFVPLYNFLTPGTITAPLIPGVPARRSIWLVMAYIIYLVTLFRALLAPNTVGPYEAIPVVTVLAFITPFDFIITEASRGEHYGYMMFCLCFSGPQWIFGCQCVQVALWTGAGVAKLGPWFQYVVCNMLPAAPFARFIPGLIKALHKDFPKDMNPSNLTFIISSFGCASEIFMGWLCVFEPTRRLGVFVTIGFHCYIGLNLPFASVQEWNIFCIWSSLYFFGQKTVQIPTELHPVLAVFLLVCLVIIPVYGQICPTRVPFLFAYRPYAGNWYFGWHVISKEGQKKLQKLKIAESAFAEEHDLLDDYEFQRQFTEYGLTGMLSQFPHFRPLLPIVEWLEQRNNWSSPNEYRVFFQVAFLNLVHGWNLGTGYNIRPGAPYYPELQARCGFKKDECFMIVCQPCSLLDHTVTWFVVDVADPKTYNGEFVLQGSAPYSELAKLQPIQMDVKQLEHYSRTSLKKQY